MVTVLKLVDPLLEWENGWTIFTILCLLQELKMLHKTECVGMMKLNHKDVQKKVKEKNLKKGDKSAAFGPCVLSNGETAKIIST
jgi:hypothetical protein